MQGERDAKENLSAAYSDAMKQLIANLRKDLKQPKMYFVIGRLSDHLKESHKSWTAVRKSQVTVSEDGPLGAWVYCDETNDRHLSTRESIQKREEGGKTGKRIARIARSAAGKTSDEKCGQQEGDCEGSIHGDSSTFT